MEILTLFLPAIENLGIFLYWLVFFFAFAESLAFVGIFVPGGTLILVAGFLSAQGYLTFEYLILFVAIGAILGDVLSYWLGIKGVKFFRHENKILKLSHLEKGEQFFKKYGNKSIFLSRFIPPIRPIIPFVAGLSKMNKLSFFLWDIIGAFLLAIVYLSLGYFFGGAIALIQAWTTRAGFFAFAFIFLSIILWFLTRKNRPIFLFFVSIIKSIKNAIILNFNVRKLVEQHPYMILSIAFVCALFLFFGISQNIIIPDLLVAIDIRVAHLFFAFRDMKLIVFFTWITLLGEWQIIVSGAVMISFLLWLWRKRAYIIPFWIALIGSEVLVFLGKIAFHRPRPELAYIVERGFSFPSGHAAIAVTFYGFLTYIFFRETKHWQRRANIIFLCIFIIFAIGLSRLYLGVHYVSDVLGGYLFGVLWLIIGIVIFEWIRNKFCKDNLTVISRKIQFISLALILAEFSFYIIFGLYYHPILNI